MKVSPLGALISIVLLGITVEFVDRESKPAAFALVVLLLLGMLVANSQQFRRQVILIITAINAAPQSDKGGGAKFS